MSDGASAGLGWLKNGNAPGRCSDARRCGARAKRTGQPCRAPACRGKRRCRLHGGRSTGPKTTAGRERSGRANWIHGGYGTERRRALATARANVALLKTRIRSERAAVIAAYPGLRRLFTP